MGEPMCNKKTKQCSQWSDKQRFEFEEGALTADQVRRASLGLWFTHPKTRLVEQPREPVPPPEPIVNYPALGFVLVLALVAILLVLNRGEGGSASRGRTLG